jgi:hypothetical protein
LAAKKNKNLKNPGALDRAPDFLGSPNSPLKEETFRLSVGQLAQPTQAKPRL